MKSNHFFLSLLLVSFLFSSEVNSQNWGNSGIKGEGPKVTKTLDLSSFDGLGLTINADVFLKQGNTQSVKIEAQQNIIDNIKTEVSEGVWKIKFDKNVGNYEAVKIWITIPELTQVALSGSGSVKGENSFGGVGELSLSLSGSGDISLDADSKSLDVGISGSGNINLGGNTGECDIRISGSGDISAFDLKAKSCSVKISGSGDASVNVNESLEVAIAGSGDVFYKGSPRIKSKISGSGEVVSK